MRLLFLSLVSCALAAQPVIQVAKRHHSFGKVSIRTPVTTTFTLSNQGDAPLQIIRVDNNCDCNVTKLPKPFLKSKESLDLELRFDPKDLKGPVRKTIFVVCNDPKQPEVALSIDAEVIPDIYCTPDAFFFSTLLRSLQETQVTRLHSSNGLPLQILEAKVETPTPFLNVKTGKEGADALLTVTVDGKQLPQDVQFGQGHILLKTNHPTCSQVKVGYYWSLVSSLDFAPSQLDFLPPPKKTSGQGTPVLPSTARDAQTLTISQLKKRPFKLTSVSAKPDFIQVDGVFPTQALGEHSLTVRIDRTKLKGSASGLLSFQTDDIDQKVVHVRVYALNP